MASCEKLIHMPSCKKLILLKLLWFELIVIIFMKLTGYALLWIITSYRWLLSKTFWTIFLFGLLHVYILPFTFTACKIESYAPNNILGIIKDHDFSFSLSVHSTTTLVQYHYHISIWRNPYTLFVIQNGCWWSKIFEEKYPPI